MESSLPPRVRALLALTAQVRVAAKAVAWASSDCASRHGVTTAEMRTLACLRDHGPLTVPRIAEVRGKKRQSIQSLVDSLRRRGLVERIKNPNHARSRLVRPTRAGMAVQRAVDREAVDSMVEVAKRLKTSELVAATRALESLVARLERVHPQE